MKHNERMKVKIDEAEVVRNVCTKSTKI